MIDCIYTLTLVSVDDRMFTRAAGWFASLEEAEENIIKAVSFDDDPPQTYVVIEMVSRGISLGREEYWYLVQTSSPDDYKTNHLIEYKVDKIEKPENLKQIYYWSMG